MRGRAAIPHAQRPLDVAYRAGELPYRLGWRGQVKHRLAEALEPAAARAGLRADLSTAEGKLLFGDDWFGLLASVARRGRLRERRERDGPARRGARAGGVAAGRRPRR